MCEVLWESFNFWPKAFVFHFICETQLVILALLPYLAYLIFHAGHIHLIVNVAHCPWDLFISDKLLTSWWCNSWLNLSTDASLLKVSLGFFYSCLIATHSYMFGIVLLLFSHFHSCIILWLHDGTSVADICQEALWFLSDCMCCVYFWSMSHSI